MGFNSGFKGLKADQWVLSTSISYRITTVFVALMNSCWIKARTDIRIVIILLQLLLYWFPSCMSYSFILGISVPLNFANSFQNIRILQYTMDWGSYIWCAINNSQHPLSPSIFFNCCQFMNDDSATTQNALRQLRKRDRLCMYNVTLRRVCATIVAVENRYILHLLKVCL